jgi:NAD(P)-dependent dehydrogenase (short-subunit alcohol dehydrogenase family)
MASSVRGCVVVTGAASGIGQAVAERLASEGRPVGLVDRDVDGLRALAGSLSGAVACPADVREDAGLVSAYETAVESCGPLVGLVTCAGIAGTLSPVDELVDMEDVFAVNALGTMRSVRSAIPFMRAAGGGSIVCVASAAAFVGTPRLAAYTATKGAVISFAKCAAVELASEGIRVNTVCPGFVQTPMTEEVGQQRGGSPHAYGSIDNLIGRPASAVEIADTIVFILSDAARFMVGADVVVDGGKLAR